MIKIIKTLEHTQHLFLPKDQACLYVRNYTFDKFSSLESAEISKIKEIKYSKLIKYLTSFDTNRLHFDKVQNIESLMEFSIKGDVISVWLPGYEAPIKFEFFDEELEKAYTFDLLTGRKIEDIHNLVLLDDFPGSIDDLFDFKISNYSSNGFSKILFSTRSLPNIKSLHDEVEYLETDFVFAELYYSNLDLINKSIESYKNNSYEVLVRSRRFEKENRVNRTVPKPLAGEISPVRGNGTIAFGKGGKLTKQDSKGLPARYLATSEKPGQAFTNEGLILKTAIGFVSHELKFVYLTDRELYGAISIERRSNIKNSPSVDKLLKQLEGEIETDDFVVHEDYGLGIYRGLKQEKVDDLLNDYLLIEFDRKDELYVPISQINKITKYIGAEGTIPQLTKLGRGLWQKARNEIRKSVFIIAKEMVQHLAKREASKSEPLDKSDSDAYLEFEDKFGYDLTPDQKRSINEIFGDLVGTKPMNRLLVGDVGFGKTEVIMRTAFKIVESVGQVMVLAPTTVLAAQHLDVFRERFKIEKKQKNLILIDIESEIACVSRFNTTKQNRELIDQFNSGEIKILIGTHRLFSSDVKPTNLKLLVVDEEQKFGVKQKEKLKRLNYSVHVLSVTATPIPRTLSLALSSIQDISIIATPPKDRKPVHTEIIFGDWGKAANAIQNELSRGGQVYFVHNRIQTIDSISAKLKEYLPGISTRIAHGSVSSTQLDKTITDFYLNKFQVLLSTSIIENGLDIPNVNTIIIHDSHTFGLSQLYQMRGRVGRSEKKAFCYLMCPKPGENLNSNLIQTEVMSDEKSVKDQKHLEKLYVQRLNSLVENQDLGAGFRIASKDLEIRGAGNILGEQQHGHISKIGYGLYIQMLAEEIEVLKKEIVI